MAPDARRVGLYGRARPCASNRRCYPQVMPGWIGPWEIVIALVVVLLFFGPKRLPEMGRGLGKGMREFRDSVTGKDDQHKQDETQAIAAHDDGQQASDEDASADAPASSRERDSVA